MDVLSKHMSDIQAADLVIAEAPAPSDDIPARESNGTHLLATDGAQMGGWTELLAR